MILSFRRPSGDPVLEAFTDRTHAWLDDARRIAEQAGFPFVTRTGGGVLLASDVLIDLHGHDASWDRLDVGVLETWLHEHGLGETVPLVLADVAVFTHFLALLGRIPDDVANAAHDRVEEMLREGSFDSRPRGPAN